MIKIFNINILLFLVLPFLSVTSYAQPWAHPGAVWHFSYMQMFSFGYIKIENTGDTTLLGNDCSILTKTQYGYYYPGYMDTLPLGKAYIYQSNNVVYFYRQHLNVFDTLYHFGALPGDSWKVRSDYIPYDSGYVHVDSITYEVYNGDTLKCLYVSPTPNSCMGWYAGTKIIERIGCINWYMLPEYIDCIMDGNEGGPLRCYQDSAFPQFIFDNQHPCDYVTALPEPRSLSETFSIFPNPASDKINVSFSQNSQGYKIRIVNMQGRLMMAHSISGTFPCQLDLTSLPTGIYTVIFSDDINPLFREKLSVIK